MLGALSKDLDAFTGDSASPERDRALASLAATLLAQLSDDSEGFAYKLGRRTT